jgi:GT2 family glycosyltransferase
MISGRSIYIILPVLDRINFTIDCIESLKSTDYNNKTIIVIDNSSSDGREDWLSKTYPDITILKGNGEFWWAKSVNLGIQYAREHHAEYIMLINNDCIVERGLLRKLIEHSLKNPGSIIAPQILDYYVSGKVLFAGKTENWISSPFKREKFKNFSYDSCPLIKTDVVYGKGTLIKSDLVELIGFFDEKEFPHYHSDIDFSLRAKRKNINMLIATDCIVWDKGIKIINFFSLKTFFSRKSNLNLKDTFNLYRKYCPFQPFFLFFFLFYLMKFIYAFVALIKNMNKKHRLQNYKQLQ